MVVKTFKEILYVKILILSDVISCFFKKNLGQNNENLINYLNKNYDYSKESAIKVVQEAVTENMVNIVLLNDKDS